MNKKVLLIGGAGYVGSELTKLLLLKNYEVTVYDLFIYGDVFNHYKNNNNLKVIKGDIRDLSYLDKVINNFHYIIHLACISNDPSFDLDPDLGKSVNFDPFEDLVKISKNNGVKRFIYASSSSVYGIKSQENVDESCSLEPITDYSKYKALCEEILFKYNDKNFISTIVRPATVCGYSERQRLDLVVNILTNHAYHNKNIFIRFLSVVWTSGYDFFNRLKDIFYKNLLDDHKQFTGQIVYQNQINIVLSLISTCLKAIKREYIFFP